MMCWSQHIISVDADREGDVEDVDRDDVLDGEYVFRTRVHCVNTCVRALSEHMREHSVFMNTK